MPVTDEFRHRTRVEVRFRDLDAFGHANNAVIASYVEQGRIAYLRDVLQVNPVSLLPLIVAMIHVDFVSPLFFGESVDIGSRVDWISRRSLRMSHHLATTDGREAARAEVILVAYDYETATPIPVPDDWRAAMTAHEGRDLAKPQGDA